MNIKCTIIIKLDDDCLFNVERRFNVCSCYVPMTRRHIRLQTADVS